jgi:hypothetical protein
LSGAREGVEFGEHFGSWTFDGVRRFSGSGPGVATCANLRLLAAHNAREALACADAYQMNCIREMVVFSDGVAAIFRLRSPAGSGI